MFDFPDTIEVAKIPAEYTLLYDESGNILAAGHAIRDSLLGMDKTIGNLRKEATRNKKQGNETVEALSGFLSELNLDDLEALGTHITGLNEAVAAKDGINPEKIRQEVEQGYIKQIQDKDAKLAETHSLLSNTVLGRDVISAVAAHNGNADLLSPYVRTRLAMVEENGVMHVRVKDADGDFIGDGKGGWMSPEAFVGTLKENPKFQGAFAPSTPGPGGMGTPPNQQPPGARQQQPGNVEKTPAQKITDGLRQRGMGPKAQTTVGAQTPPGMD